ncbi:mechanosensitive ion channel family protein [Calditrichota bacterium]
MLGRFFESIIDVDLFIQKFTLWLPNLIAAFIILAAFYIFWRLLNGASVVMMKRAKLDQTAISFVLTLLKYTVLTIGIVTALGKIGVNTVSILTSLGVVGLTIGFAAKDALSNMISGIFIFWDRPFVIGDLVEIEGNYGKVDSITMRSTRVVTPDGRMLAVPNTKIVNSTVASYTNFPHLRLDIAFTVGVNEDIGKIREIALGVCSSMKELMQDPKPDVAVNSLNDYNIELRLSTWLTNEATHIRIRDTLREKLFEALRSASIDMPYETLAIAPLTIKNENA